MLGRGWRRGSDPVAVAVVERELYRLAHQRSAVDTLATTWPAWTAGRSARSLLPGVALLADLV